MVRTLNNNKMDSHLLLTRKCNLINTEYFLYIEAVLYQFSAKYRRKDSFQEIPSKEEHGQLELERTTVHVRYQDHRYSPLRLAAESGLRQKTGVHGTRAPWSHHTNNPLCRVVFFSEPTR